MKRVMTVTDWVHVIAGVFIMASLALGLLLSPWWFCFTGFVGLNLFQFGFSGFCPMAIFLKKLGIPCERPTGR